MNIRVYGFPRLHGYCFDVVQLLINYDIDFFFFLDIKDSLAMIHQN